MTKGSVRAFIGLGSNLDDPLQQVRRAMDALRGLPLTRLIERSRLYRSEPIGPGEQSSYINAAALLETALAPVALLDALHGIERQQGRVRRVRWGPRTLDLDLLLYGDQVLNPPGPVVPHPHLHQRAFVLLPLLDIEPALEIPGLGPAAVLLAGLDPSGVEPLDGNADAR